MKVNRRSRRYAKALFDISQKEIAASLVLEGLKFFASFLDREKLFRAFYYSRKIPSLQKRKLISSFFKETIHPLVLEIATILDEKKEHNLLPNIIHHFERLKKKDPSMVEVNVFSSSLLDEETFGLIRSSVERATRKQVEAKHFVNEDLIGGVQIRVGNTLFDGSIKNLLGELKQSLVQ